MNEEIRGRLIEAQARAFVALEETGHGDIAATLQGNVDLYDVNRAIGRLFSEGLDTPHANKTADALLDLRRLLRLADFPPNGHEGMPCPDCGVPQKRLDVSRHPDGGLLVHVSYAIAKDKVASEIGGLCSLLRSFVR